MTIKSRRDIMAHHEAAHAVIARVLGVEVLGVAMFPTDDVGLAGALTRSASYYSGADTAARIAGLEIDIKVALAGPVANAQNKKGSLSRFRKQGEVDDIKRSNSMAVVIAMLTAGETLPHHHDGLRITVEAAIIESANAILARLRAETEALLVEALARGRECSSSPHYLRSVRSDRA
jgi:hypothetical protein